MTTPNDYDKFAGSRQEKLKSGQIKSHQYVEKPAMKKLLPDLNGKQVLMVGCGTGEESVILEERGAKNLIGIDISQGSIDLANASYPQHTFQVGDMHKLEFEDGSFDFIYSSLTVDYTGEPLTVYKEMFRVLKPGGQLLFSAPHPMRWSVEEVEIDGARANILGSAESAHPKLFGSYMKYQEKEFKFDDEDSVLRFWIGPPSMHFRLLKEAGFVVDDFVETQAIEECKTVNPYYYERYTNFPQFSIFLATKS